jgi:hypothetical protein
MDCGPVPGPLQARSHRRDNEICCGTFDWHASPGDGPMSIRIFLKQPRLLISRTAILCAISICTIGETLGVCLGRSAPQAISHGVAAAICGLIGWVIYRVGDPTNDVLPFFGMVMGTSIYQAFARFLPGSVSPFLGLVPIVWCAALFARGSAAMSDDPGGAGPLYDPEVDEAAKTPVTDWRMWSGTPL